MYWDESLARFRGKYRVAFSTIGYDTVRSKAEYGRMISTVADEVKFPTVNVICGSCACRVVC